MNLALRIYCSITPLELQFAPGIATFRPRENRSANAGNGPKTHAEMAFS